MRLSPFATTFLCVAFPVVCFAQTVTSLRATQQGHLVVQVSINGAGPYCFLLDTGSNRTLVRNELLDRKRFLPGRGVTANMATGVSYLQAAVVSKIAVGESAVHELAVAGIDAGEIDRLGESVDGVLGEDFLKHFDLLIDNHAKTLTLDDSADLASSLTGDRVPLSFSGTRDGRSTVDRVVLNVALRSSGETEHFLIDSGSNYAMFFPSKPLPHQGRIIRAGTLETLGGSARCRVDFVTVGIGKSTLPDVGLAFCQGMRSNLDVDGLLPTNTFARLFISHSGAYAMANPRFRKASVAGRFHSR